MAGPAGRPRGRQPPARGVGRVASAPQSGGRKPAKQLQAQLERDDDSASRYIEVVRSERVRLQQKLRELGARAAESQANFVLGGFHDAAFVRDALAGLPDKPKKKRILKARSIRKLNELITRCLLYTSPSPRDGLLSRMPSSA